MQELSVRVQKVEDFIKTEEEKRKEAGLQPDAGQQEVIAMVNALSHKVNGLDESMQKGLAAKEELLKKEGIATGEILTEQKKNIEKMTSETESQIGQIKFDASMANIRSHILKLRMDLANRNIGTAKTEIDLINDLFGKAASSASEENRKAVEELRSMLAKARSEIDSDLPAAVNRIDLIWYEMGKLLRKA
jgi:ElaB/YqjD/DUF883 family membrane-anchored ribosome-binding protein